MSHTSELSFDAAYSRGWSGKTGRAAISAFRDNTVAGYSAHYYKVDPTRASSSGWGSNLGPITERSVSFLRTAILKYQMRSMIDVPCGDVNWQFGAFEIDALAAYVGLDISSRLVRLNGGRFAFHSNKVFAPWDMAACAMPRVAFRDGTAAVPVELIHMRYVLQHMALDRALAAVVHVVESGAKFFIATTYPNQGRHNTNTQIGKGSESHFYLNNLLLPPFSLPPPVACVQSPLNLGNDSTCLFDLRDRSEMARWLERARRTRIVGTRKTTRIIVQGEPEPVYWVKYEKWFARNVKNPEEWL